MCIFLCKEINSDISQSFVSFKIIFETYSSPEPPGNYSLPNFILEISIFPQPPGNFPGISPTPQKISSIGGGVDIKWNGPNIVNHLANDVLRTVNLSVLIFQ